MKDIKEEVKKWRDISCSWVGKLNIVSSSQLDLQIQCNPNQNPIKLFCGYQQTDSKVYMETQNKQRKQNKTKQKTSEQPTEY